MSNKELWNYIPVWLTEFVDRKYIKKKEEDYQSSSSFFHSNLYNPQSHIL